MRFAEYEKINIRSVRAVMRVDEDFRAGSKVPRRGPSPADRLFFVTSFKGDPADGGPALIQRWSGNAQPIFVGDVVFIPRSLSYSDEILCPNISILAFIDLDLPQEANITKWRFGGNSEMNRMFSSLLQIWTKANAGYYAQCMQILYGILRLLTKQEQARYSNPAAKILAPALEYMNEHMRDEISIPDLASICGISYSHFRKCFHDVYGVSAKTHLEQLRLDAAKNLLELSDFSVSEIAARCGFSDLYYFSNFFKKMTGLNPRAYRRKSIGENTAFDQKSTKNVAYKPKLLSDCSPAKKFL